MPCRPRTEQVARKHSRESQTEDKCTRLRSSLNKSRTPLRKRTFPTHQNNDELSVEDDEFVEDTAHDVSDGEDSEVRSAAEAAFFAGWRAKQKTADIWKTRGVQELSSSSNIPSSSGKGACVARDDRPRDHRDRSRKRNSWRAAREEVGWSLAWEKRVKVEEH